MEIVKKIAMEKMFMRSANEQLILMEKARLKHKRIQGQQKHDFEPPSIEDEFELSQKVEDGLITLKTSQSSFKFSEVTQFTYGPFVSRFWMLRKHMILMDITDLN